MHFGQDHPNKGSFPQSTVFFPLTFANLQICTLAHSNKKHTISLLGFGLTLLGALLFSTKAIIVKKAFAATQVDAVSLLALRMACALPFYLAAVWLVGRKEHLRPLSPRQWWQVLGLGLIGYYCSSLFDFIGLQYISAGLERLILFLYPSFAVLINTVVFRQKVSRLQWAALLLTYLGIAIAYWGELRLDTGNPGFYWGSFCVLLCAVTYAIYIVGSGRLIPQTGATRFTAYAMLAATGGVFLHFALRGQVSPLYGQPGFWWYGLLLGVVATVVPSFLISGGLKRIGSNNVAIISAIGPVSTILQAHFILGEPIFAAQVAGTVLVIAGVLLTALPGQYTKWIHFFKN
jgi:drug/metabolite transporter (DMT)-like permease